MSTIRRSFSLPIEYEAALQPIDAGLDDLLGTDRADSAEKIEGRESWPMEGEIPSEEVDEFFLLLRILAWDFYVRRGVTITRRLAMFSLPENEAIQLEIWSLIGVDNRRACSLLLGELEGLLDFPKGHLRNGGLEAGLRVLEHWFENGGFAYNRHPGKPREVAANELRAAPKKLFELSTKLNLPPMVPTERLGNIQVLIAVGFVFVGCYGSSYWPHQLVDAGDREEREPGTKVRLNSAGLLDVLGQYTGDFRWIPEAWMWSDFRRISG